MLRHKWIRLGLAVSLIAQALVSLAAPATASASPQELSRPRTVNPAPVERPRPIAPLQPVNLPPPSPPTAPETSLLQNGMPTLTLEIMSSPWAVLDNTDIDSGPRILLIEAVITNTSSMTPVEDVLVTLDYGKTPPWVLMDNEDPDRTFPTDLGAGDAFHAYWFAHYSAGYDLPHQYTVTVSAANAISVTQSQNYHNPQPDRTVQTLEYRSTGNSGAVQASAKVVVGVAFTMSVEYDLGTDSKGVSISPVGNEDFDPGAYRLLTSTVRFFEDPPGTQEKIVEDRLYVDPVPSFADNAEATFTFIALQPANTALCSYNAVEFSNGQRKYDQFYCDVAKETIIPITGTLSLSMTKRASSLEIQQGQRLTYTIHYTNNGDLPMTESWVWDDVDPNFGSIITESIEPPSDPDESTDSRVAWRLGTIEPGYSGTLTFTILVDGNDQDLTDGTDLVNHAFFGINPGSLPQSIAMTRTVTTTIQAPVISVDKTDGLEYVEAGDSLAYTLQVANSGSITATGLVVTDVLPADVNYTDDAADPDETTRIDQTLIWTLPDIPDILPDETTVITVPVTVGITVPNGSILTNTMAVEYANTAGYTYTVETATDTTVVQAPVLSISKSDYPDPILVVAGNRLTYTLHCVNTGPVTVTVLVTDVVPISTTYQTCSGGSSCGSTGPSSGSVVTWTATIPGNQSGDVSFSVEVITDAVKTGDLIYNDDYGLYTAQTGFVFGPPVTTQVNKRAAFVNVYTFVDDNGDGNRDTGEGDLPGVTVRLAGTNVPLIAGTTSITGFHQFRIERQTQISVTADPLGDYFQTTPGVVFTNTVLGKALTVTFGYAPVTSTFGVINGTVFEDTDHDGIRDLGENGLPNVTITSTAFTTRITTTDSFGWYVFSYTVTPVTVTITEDDPDFYVSTTPNVVTETGVVSGSSRSIDFGDFRGIKVTGQVFDDANVNGVNDDGTGLEEVEVAANGDSTQTDGSGNYALYVTVHDSNQIDVVETDLDDYRSTNAIPGNDMVKQDANTLLITNPISGTTYSGADFGDVLASSAITISGQVWNDNGACTGCLVNGLLDPGEGGLGGAIVSLSSGLTQTTSSDGRFLLYAPPYEVIVITETNPTGYVSTNAIPGNDATKINHDTLVVTNTLAGGSTSENNLFGDVSSSIVAIITGTVFDDQNESGTLDGGDTYLPDVMVTMEISGGNTIAVLTDSDGRYQFAVAPGTDVRVASAGPGGSYYPTTPEEVFLSPSATIVYPGVNFGYSDDEDADIAVIYGIVFDDVNSNGKQDFGELGLAGAQVRLLRYDSVSTTITTTGNGVITGTFRFTATEAGFYSVQEFDPPGYRSTTPNEVNVEITTPLNEADRYVEFGDTNSPRTASIYGTVFEDLNGNGKQDFDETGIAGVVISATVGGEVLTMATRHHGAFSYGFYIDEPGLHTIDEQDPAKPGYRSTTPDHVVVRVQPNVSRIVNFGDVPISATFSNIMGTVFDDWSGDGVQGPTEAGIPDVLLSLSTGITTTTDKDWGWYTFPISATHIPTYVQVMEIDPINYHSTTPNTVTVNVTDTGRIYVVNFGDSDDDLVSSLFGTVFNDENANGVRDPTELGLSDATITITDTFDILPGPYVTNDWGQFTFLIENMGTYTITEQNPEGYVSTNAIPGSLSVSKVDNDTLRATISSPGVGLNGNLFGDVLATDVITISGTVWEDNGAGGGTAADGVRNGSEPGLAGAQVSLSSGMAQTTGSDGTFLLYAPPSQVITVTETNPTVEYISTNAIPGGPEVSKFDNDILVVNDTLAGGATSSGNLFGDVLPTDLTVVKSDSPDPVAPDITLTYTLVYTNGPLFAQGVTITDTLPTDVTYGGVVSTVPPITLIDESPPTWYTPTLAAGASGTIVFTVTVNSGAGGTITNHVEITSNTPDANTGDNADDEPTFVINPDIAISKSPDVQFPESGDPVIFTIAVTNTGDVTLTNVSVVDNLAPDCTREVANLTTVAPSTSYTCTVIATSDFTNTATVTGTPPVGPDVSASDTAFVDVVGPNIKIIKSPGIQKIDIGATATFTITVTNESDPFEDLTNVIVADALSPDCARELGNLTTTVPTSYTCTVTNVMMDLLNSATVTGTAATRDVYDTDTAFVDVLPTIAVTKTASPTSLPEPGGTVTFTVRVGNTSFETVTLTSLNDDVHGNLNGQGDCTVPQNIPTSDFYSCTFTATVSGNAGDSETDTVSAQAQDDESNTVSVQDSATVDITDAMPDITVTKTANPTSVDMPGGDVTFTVRVDNIGVEAVTLITLTDSIYGDLNGQGDCSVPQTIPVGTPYTCAFTATVSGSEGYSETNTVTAWAQDDENNTDSAQDSATVTVLGGPWTCLPDSYEEDDDPTQATPIQTGYAYSQTHDFCDDATDWITFTAQAGDLYTITTSSWGQRADTFLALFDTDAQTPLAANDDYEEATDYSSRIVWEAHADGVYYVRVTNQAGLTGRDTDYHVWVERQDVRYLYLPIVMRNHTAAGGGVHDLLHPSQRVLGTEATSTSTATGPSAALNPTGVISHTCPDAYDEPPDDTWENARPIEVGVVQVHSFDSDPASYAADKDYVWFDVSEFYVSTGKTITFTVKAVTHTQTLMQLHDEDGDALVGATGTYTKPLTWAPDAAGRYHLSVSPEDRIFTFGCVDQAGYDLLLAMEEIQSIYLPVAMRNY